MVDPILAERGSGRVANAKKKNAVVLDLRVASRAQVTISKLVNIYIKTKTKNAVVLDLRVASRAQVKISKLIYAY